MPTPAICELTGTVFTGQDTSLSAPEPFVGKYLTITPLSLTGSLLSTKSFTITSDSAGLFAVGLYQGGQYLIKGEVAGYDTPRGTVVTVPLIAAATLESLIYPVTGLTVQDEGVDLATLIGKFNFTGAGVTVTQPSAGVATISITSGGGSVTSVGLTLPAIFTVMGSPVTTTGTLSATLANQTANTIFAGPASGPVSGPTFRALVAADIPPLPYATEAYADALVLGLLDDRGNFNASGNTFPSTGGSGIAGAILKGDLWTISVAGTLGGHPVTVGDVVRALVDTPGQTDANWAIGENNFGYVALNQALASGQIYVGNGSGIGTAVTPSGDVTINNAGVTAIGVGKVTNSMLAGSIDLTTKVTGILPAANGGSGVNNLVTLNFGAGGTLGSNAFNSTAFVPQTTTVNGKALSGNITLGLASADFVNQGTATTVLHGNAAGNPSFGQIVNTDIANGTIDLAAKVTGLLPVANAGIGISLATIAKGGMISGTGAGTLGITTVGTDGQVWTADAASAGGAKWAAAAGGGGNPFDDGTAIIKGSADATKLLRFEVDGFTTGTTRVLTPPNSDGTIAVLGLAQTFSAVQTFSANPIITNTAPGLVFTDTTASAKGLTVAVDANVADLRESAGASGSLVALDLANNRMGVGTAAPGRKLHLFDSVNHIWEKIEATGAGKVASLELVANGNTWEIGNYGSFGTPTNSLQIYSGGALKFILEGGPTPKLTLGSNASASPIAQTIAADSSSGGTNINGASPFSIIGSLGTSTGVPGRVTIKTGALDPTSGTTAHTAVERLVVGATKVLANNTVTTLVNVTNASNTVASGIVSYTVECFDGTDLQIETGEFIYQVSNKGGTIANNTITSATGWPKNVTTSGTLTVTFAISAANPALLSINANSSLTPSSGYPRVTYQLRNNTQQAIAVQ